MWMETREVKLASVRDGGAYCSSSMTRGLIPAAVRETAVMLVRTTCGGMTLLIMRDEIGVWSPERGVEDRNFHLWGRFRAAVGDCA